MQHTHRYQENTTSSSNEAKGLTDRIYTKTINHPETVCAADSTSIMEGDKHQRQHKQHKHKHKHKSKRHDNAQADANSATQRHKQHSSSSKPNGSASGFDLRTIARAELEHQLEGQGEGRSEGEEDSVRAAAADVTASRSTGGTIPSWG